MNRNSKLPNPGRFFPDLRLHAKAQTTQQLLFKRLFKLVEILIRPILPADGEPVDDWNCSVGKVVWTGLQLPGRGRCYWCRSLPLLCGHGWTHRGHEASPGPALLCILCPIWTKSKIKTTIFNDLTSLPHFFLNKCHLKFSYLMTFYNKQSYDNIKPIM